MNSYEVRLEILNYRISLDDPEGGRQEAVATSFSF